MHLLSLLCATEKIVSGGSEYPSMVSWLIPLTSRDHWKENLRVLCSRAVRGDCWCQLGGCLRKTMTSWASCSLGVSHKKKGWAGGGQPVVPHRGLEDGIYPATAATGAETMGTWQGGNPKEKGPQTSWWVLKWKWMLKIQPWSEQYQLCAAATCEHDE